jgi:hypothetical protein
MAEGRQKTPRRLWVVQHDAYTVPGAQIRQHHLTGSFQLGACFVARSGRSETMGNSKA